MTYTEKDYMDMINGKFDPNKKEEESKENEKNMRIYSISSLWEIL